MLVPLGLDPNIEDLAFGVHGSPEIDHSAVGLQIDLVQKPNRIRPWAALFQLGGDKRPEMVHPAPHRLV
jgi:hypothetical protein